MDERERGVREREAVPDIRIFERAAGTARGRESSKITRSNIKSSASIGTAIISVGR